MWWDYVRLEWQCGDPIAQVLNRWMLNLVLMITSCSSLMYLESRRQCKFDMQRSKMFEVVCLKCLRIVESCGIVADSRLDWNLRINISRLSRLHAKIKCYSKCCPDQWYYILFLMLLGPKRTFEPKKFPGWLIYQAFRTIIGHSGSPKFNQYKGMGYCSCLLLTWGQNLASRLWILAWGE